MFKWLERNPFFFAVAVFIVIAYAGIVEVLPNFATSARPIEGKKPYTLLELAGRQIYIENSCNACHTQMIRPFKSETDRYGEFSKSGEFAYDRPHLWGSKRTGPDLMRVGNYRTTDWHEVHMKDPSEAIGQKSIMPAYKHLFTKDTDLDTAYAEAVTINKVFNVPYNKANMPILPDTLDKAKAQMEAEAAPIVEQMRDKDVKEAFKKGEIKQIVALIAYLNSLK